MSIGDLNLIFIFYYCLHIFRHLVLKYGVLKGKQSCSEESSKTQRTELLRLMYRKSLGSAATQSTLTVKEEEEEELDEVDQLVQWTQNLDERLLNAST